jgi:hypothetical protein
MEEGKLIFRGVMTFGTKTDFINISKSWREQVTFDEIIMISALY